MEMEINLGIMTKDQLKKFIVKLEEENKNLKLIQETNEKQIQNDIKERDELREENKKLKLENADLMGERDGLKMVVEKLKEENQTLELWLDNKEKLKNLNGRIANLKEEVEDRGKIIEYYKNDKKLTEKHIKKLKDRIKELIGKIGQLEEENEKLRKDLFHKTNNGKTK